MTKIMRRIHDLATGKVIDREMTDDEYKVYSEMLAQDEADLTAKLAAESAKAAAQEKLAALGLTTDDLKALGL